MLTFALTSTWSGRPWPFAFMLFITRVSGLGRDREPDRALALCQWKLSETSLDTFKSGGVKQMTALSRAKFPYDSLFSFYVHTAELVPSTLYTFAFS